MFTNTRAYVQLLQKHAVAPISRTAYLPGNAISKKPYFTAVVLIIEGSGTLLEHIFLFRMGILELRFNLRSQATSFTDIFPVDLEMRAHRDFLIQHPYHICMDRLI